MTESSIASIEEVASRWLARLDRGALRPEEQAAFDAWWAADPRHAAAYAELERVWKGLDHPQAFPSARRWKAVVGIAAVMAVAALTLVLLYSTFNRTAQPTAHDVTAYVTTIGGHEQAQLADGSRVELNTDTELDVVLDRTQRRIELKRGEATFEVAHDAQRPFIVTAGAHTVTAVGTVFNVRRRSAVVEILVIEGSVAAAGTVIQAGSWASATATELQVRKADARRIERALAWHQGLLSFDDATLLEVAGEFNRYNTVQLVVDPGVAAVRIGGRFQARNVEGFLWALEQDFGLRVTRESHSIHLHAAQ